MCSNKMIPPVNLRNWLPIHDFEVLSDYFSDDFLNLINLNDRSIGLSYHDPNLGKKY